MKKIYIFDFDNTLISVDSNKFLLLNLLFLNPLFILKNLRIILRLYTESNPKKKQLIKQVLYNKIFQKFRSESYNFNIYIKLTSLKFFNYFKSKFNNLLKKKNSIIIVITSSPEYLVKKFFNKNERIIVLGCRFKEINRKVKLYQNSYGQNKKEILFSYLNSIKTNYIISEVWSDNLSDIPILKLGFKNYALYTSKTKKKWIKIKHDNIQLINRDKIK